MKKLNLTPYQLLIAKYVLLAVLAVIVLYRLPKALNGFLGITEEPDFEPVPMPTENSTGIDLTPAQFKEVRGLSQRLHTDMKGIAVPGMRDNAVYSELLELTDPMLVAVYNDFGKLYYSLGEGTLREWLNSENFWYTFSLLTPWGAYSAKQFTAAINQRFDLLNLQ